MSSPCSHKQTTIR